MEFEVPQREMGRAGVIVQFHVVAKPDKAASLLAGRPVMKDVDYIRIMTPGSNTNVVDKPVDADAVVKYGQQYEHWRRTRENPVSGQPLREWPPLRPSEVETLAHANVRTVEELAEISDANLQRLGAGFATFRQRARDFLKAAKEEGYVASMRAEMDGMKAQLEATRKQLDETMAELRALKPHGTDTKPVETPKRAKG